MIKMIDLGYGIELKGEEENAYNRTVLGTRMYKAPEIIARKPYQG